MAGSGRRRLVAAVTLLATGGLMAGALGPAQAGVIPSEAKERKVSPATSEQLAEKLKAAVDAQKFDQLVDNIPPATLAAAKAKSADQGYDITSKLPLTQQAAGPLPPQMPNVDSSAVR